MLAPGDAAGRRRSAPCSRAADRSGSERDLRAETDVRLPVGAEPVHFRGVEEQTDVEIRVGVGDLEGMPGGQIGRAPGLWRGDDVQDVLAVLLHEPELDVLEEPHGGDPPHVGLENVLVEGEARLRGEDAGDAARVEARDGVHDDRVDDRRLLRSGSAVRLLPGAVLLLGHRVLESFVRRARRGLDPLGMIWSPWAKSADEKSDRSGVITMSAELARLDRVAQERQVDQPPEHLGDRARAPPSGSRSRRPRRPR